MTKQITIEIIVFLITLSTSSFAQNKWTLTGTVVDESNKEPIPIVNIYISNTTIGTTSDNKGMFRIPAIPFESITVVFSCIGFETVTKQVIFKDDKTLHLNVEMEEMAYDLPSINVVEKENEEWQRNFRVFSLQFLGNNYDPDESEITNPYSINFSSTFEGKLTAECKVPLVILNDYLGYKITYHLKEFVYHNPNLKFYGTMFFKENLSPDSEKADKQLRNRQFAYAGSMRHLLKTMNNFFVQSQEDTAYKVSPEDETRLEMNSDYMSREGFTVSITNRLPKKLNKPSTAFPVNTNSLIRQGISTNELVLRFQNFLRIDFNPQLIEGKLSDIGSGLKHSWITLESREAYIDLTSWSIDEYTIRSYGHWANMRVLDMLPLDYKP